MRRATYSAEKSIRHNLIYFNAVNSHRLSLKMQLHFSTPNYRFKKLYSNHQQFIPNFNPSNNRSSLIIRKLLSRHSFHFSKNCRCEKGSEERKAVEHVFKRISGEKISVGVLPLLSCFQRFLKQEEEEEEEGPRLTGIGNISRYWLEWLCLSPLDTVSTASLHAHAFENNFSSSVNSSQFSLRFFSFPALVVKSRRVKVIFEFVTNWLIERYNSDELLIIKLVENCPPIENDSNKRNFKKGMIWLDFYFFVNAIKSMQFDYFYWGKIIKRYYLKDHWFKGYCKVRKTCNIFQTNDFST